MTFRADHTKSPAEQIQEAAEFAGVPASVIDGIWRTESARGTHKTMVGPKTKWGTAKGHFQQLDSITETWSKRLGKKFDPMNFSDGLTMVAHHLKENMGIFKGDVDQAILAYHGGMDKKNWGKNTRDYLVKVKGDLGTQATIPKGDGSLLRPDGEGKRPHLPGKVIWTADGIAAPAATDNSISPDSALFGRSGTQHHLQQIHSDTAKAEATQAHKDAQGFTDGVAAAYDLQMNPTFRMFEMLMSGADDFKTDPKFQERKEREWMKLVEGYNLSHEQEFLLGANNEREYNKRKFHLDEQRHAQQRLDDYSTGIGAFAATMVAGLADPTTYIAAGAARTAFRAAGVGANVLAQQGRIKSSIASAAGEGALGNVAYEGIRALSGEHRGVEDYAFAAAFGMIPAVTQAISAPKIHAEFKNAEALRLAGQELLRQAASGRGIPTVENLRQQYNEIHQGGGRSGDIDVRVAEDFEPMARTARGNTPMPSLEGTAKVDITPLKENAEFQALESTGVVRAVSDEQLKHMQESGSISKFQEIPADAVAVYVPQSDQVFLLVDRMTKEQLDNPRGLIAHEVGVHYGLERVVGSKTFDKIIRDINNSNDPRAIAARRSVPDDTQAYLRGEEMLGYLAENAPNSPLGQRVISSVRNWLRDNIGAFKNLEVTVNDALSYIQGVVKQTKKRRLQGSDWGQTVWHGSHVRDIPDLDTAFIGTGEGNATFGWGLYVTQERGTALHYRNKEAARRGIAPQDGGLYRLHMNVKVDDLLPWDSEVPRAMAQEFGFPEGTTGAQLYKELTTRLGSQKAASEYLDSKGVPGVKYATGNVRRGKAVGNLNLVLFNNASLKMDLRFSRRASVPGAPTALEMRYGLDMLPYDTAEERMRKQAIVNLYKEAEDWAAKNPRDDARIKTILDNDQFNLASPATVLARSENPLARWYSAKILEHTMGAHGRQTNAAIAAHVLNQHYMGNYLQDYDGLYTAWRGSQATWFEGVKDDLGKRTLLNRFDREVAVEIESRAAGLETQANQFVKAAADKFEKQMERALHEQVAAKTPGYQALPKTSRGYMSRVLDSAKVRNMSAAHKRAYHRALAEQLEHGGEGMDAGFAHKVAGIYLEHAINRATGFAEVPADPTHPQAAAHVRAAAVAAGMTKEEMRTLERALSFGAAGHTKARLQLDVLKVHTDPVTGESFQLIDLYKHDTKDLLRGYARRVAGEVALTRYGVQGSAGLELIVDALKYGGDGKQLDNVQLRALKQTASELLGRPVDAASDNMALDGLTTYTSMNQLGGVAFTQLGEYSRIAQTLGLTNMLKVLGATRRLKKEINALRRGETVENSILAGIELRGGGGEFGLDGYQFSRFDTNVNENAVYGHAEGNALTKLLHVGKHTMSTLNMQRAIIGIQERGVAEQIVLKATRLINAGTELDAHLLDMGFTPDLQKAIKAELRNIATFDSNGRLRTFDLDKAQNPETIEAFRQAVSRGTKQTIQGTFIGERGWYTHSSMGRFLSQFRTFSLTAMEKQWGRTVGMHGGGFAGYATATATLMSGMAVASPIYAARVYANSLGRDDADEYIANAFTPANLFKNLMNYTAMSGMLMDVVNGLYGVTSAINDDFKIVDVESSRPGAGQGIAGILPGLSTVNRVLSIPSNLDDPKKLIQALPYQNLPYAAPLANALAKPKEGNGGQW